MKGGGEGGGALTGGILQYKDIGTATEVGESYGGSVLVGCDCANVRSLTLSKSFLNVIA